MLALFVAATAFTAPHTPAGCGLASAPCMSLSSHSSRRAALATGASFAALAAIPAGSALAETQEEALERIVAKNKLAQEKEREEARKKIEKNRGKVEKENAGSNLIVGVIGAASFVFSLPFFYKNLGRLFLRYRSVVDKSIDESQFNKDYSGPAKRRPGGRR